ncbi:MAG: endonuclease/exonuclease/phosphatase family protein, partial [Chitinophagales bacterium]
ENNKNITSVAKAALASNADVLSFQELQQRTLTPLDTVLKKIYPYSVSDLTMKGYGMAVYSKFPIVRSEVVKQHNFPMLTGVIQLEGKEFQFISATVSSPKNEKGYNEQMKQLKVISNYADSIPLPLLVMGDMNAVPWSEQIENFQTQTRLKDSRKDLSSTFPANSVIQVPIDYIFHSEELKCVDFKTLKPTSSNHLGIIGYYKFDEVKQKK